LQLQNYNSLPCYDEVEYTDPKNFSAEKVEAKDVLPNISCMQAAEMAEKYRFSLVT